MTQFRTSLFLLLFALSAAASAQNLVPNGSFDGTISPWFIDSRFVAVTDFTWLPDDGGIGRIANTSSAADGLSYVYSPCIPITANESLVFSGRMRRPSGQTGSANAWIFLYLYSEPICASPSAAFGTGPRPTTEDEDTWQTYELSPLPVPADARGARVGLIVQKYSAGAPYHFLFDDLVVIRRAGAPALGIIGSSSVTQNTPATFNASATNCTAPEGGWRWTVPGGTFTTDASRSQVTVTFPTAGDFTVTANHQSCAGATATVPVVVNPQGAQIVVTSLPTGIVQYAGVGGGRSAYTLANRGGLPTTVTLTAEGGFFDHAQTSLNMPAGASAVVLITGRAQPAGTLVGTSRISGQGVPAGLSVSVQLLSAPIPAGAVSLNSPPSRLDVPIQPGQNASGGVIFRNTGTVLVQGIVTSTVTWMTPDTAFVSIPPGQAVQVNFTIDQAQLASAGIAAGSAVGNLVVTYVRSGPAAGAKGIGADADPPPPSSKSSAAVAVTRITPVTGASIPAFALGEFAYVVPVISGADAIVDVRVGGRLGSSSINGATIFLQSPGVASALRVSLPSFGSTPLLFTNIARSTFQLANPSGSLQIRSTSNDSIIPFATLQATVSGSTASTALPVFRSDRASGPEEAISLPGLRKDANNSTDVFVQEMNGGAVSTTLHFRNDAGVSLSSTTRELTPFGVVELTDAVPVGATQLTVQPTGSGRVVIYAVARHSSGSRAVIADWRRLFGASPSEALVLPIVTSNSGTSANRRYDLNISNLAGNGITTVTAEYYQRSSRTRPARRSGVTTGSGGPKLKSWTIESGGARLVRDLATEFGVTSLNGHVVLRNTGGKASLVVQGIDSSSNGEATSVVIPLIPAAMGKGIGGFSPFLFDDTPIGDTSRAGAFHADLGLIETGGSPARVRVTLSYPSTGSAAVATPSGEFTVNAHSSLAVKDIVGTLLGSSRDSLGDLRGVRLQTQVIGGEGRVLSYVVQRDNVTGDWLVRPPQP